MGNVKLKLPWKGFNGYLAGIRFENSESIGNVPKRSLELLKSQFGDKLTIIEEAKNESRNKNTKRASKEVRPKKTQTNDK